VGKHQGSICEQIELDLKRKMVDSYAGRDRHQKLNRTRAASESQAEAKEEKESKEKIRKEMKECVCVCVCVCVLSCKWIES
jgi:hypothetical protein